VELRVAPSDERLQDAAVLVPLYRDEERHLRVVLMRRTDWGIHGGQISLPGGVRSQGDGSMVETALRETEEEIGLPRENAEVLVELPIVETMTTGFRIYPFLARIRRPENWKPEEREVAEILEVRIRDLANPEAHGEELWEFPRRRGPERIAFYRIGDHKLWGATYRILSPILARLLAGEWDL
jgi:8-oxo-dGTP pyrophosphatase MutT (NUDIX family)